MNTRVVTTLFPQAFIPIHRQEKLTGIHHESSQLAFILSHHCSSPHSSNFRGINLILGIFIMTLFIRDFLSWNWLTLRWKTFNGEPFELYMLTTKASWIELKAVSRLSTKRGRGQEREAAETMTAWETRYSYNSQWKHNHHRGPLPLPSSSLSPSSSL